MTTSLNEYTQRLAELIQNYGSISNPKGLANNFSLICNFLKNLDFSATVYKKEGQSPIIVAQRPPIKTTNSHCLGLYGHYDVETLEEDGWLSEPLEVTERDGRFFCRGIADNLGILLLRIMVLEKRSSNQPTPGIFWLLQGEEEIGSPFAHEIFPQIALPEINIWFEETGYFDIATHRQRILEVKVVYKNR